MTKTTVMRIRTWASALLLGGAALLATGCESELPEDRSAAELGETQQAATAAQIYAALKRFEAANPPEAPAVEFVDLGAFYPALSCAQRAAQTSACFPGGGKWKSTYSGPTSHITWEHLERTVAVHGRSVSLKIRVSGASSMTVVANGRSFTGTNLTIPVGAAPQNVYLTLRSGSKSHTEVIVLRQGPNVGAGAFTIPVLPVAILYEPAQRPGFNPANAWEFQFERNTQSYTTATIVGSTVEQTRGSTRADVGYEPPSTLGNHVGTISRAYEAIGGGGDVGAGLKALASGLGSATGTQTSGVTDQLSRGFSVTTTISSTTTTNSGLGPGYGDQMIYLKNVKVAWLWDGVTTRLSIIGHDGETPMTAKQMRDYVSVLRQTAPTSKELYGLEGFLRMNPFVAGGPRPTLSGPRFGYVGPFGVAGSTRDYSQEVATATWSTAATESFSVLTEDHHTGWLSTIGLGETREYSSRLSFTYGFHRGAQQASVVRAGLHLVGRATDNYTVLAYHDRVFNSFAVRSAATGPVCVSCGNN